MKIVMIMFLEPWGLKGLGMAGLIKRALIGRRVKSPADSLNRFAAQIRNTTEEHCAEILVATSLAAGWLQVTTATKLQFPEVFLSGRRLVTFPEERNFLSLYIDEIKVLKEVVKSSQAADAAQVAGGLVVLIHSIRCVQDRAQFLIAGRALWQDLLRGQSIASEMTDALFVPRMLAPSWEPLPGWQLAQRPLRAPELQLDS